MSSFPLLQGFEAASTIGWCRGEPVTAARFCASALELAERLPRKRYVLNLCEDRLNFMLALSAALIAGQASLLPPSRAAGVVREIFASHPDACCLADHNELPAGLPAMIVPPWPARSPATLAMPSIPAGQVAMIVFTSGSTGRPQPHAKTWRSLVFAARALASRLEVAAGGTFSMLGTVPPQHMYGVETTIMLPLQSGMAIHPARPLLPADIAAALAELPPARWLATTPIHLRACIGENVVFPELAGVLCATMPLPADTALAVESRWSVPVFEIYGCTEAGTVALRRPAHDERWLASEGLHVRQKSGDVWVSGGHLESELKLPDCLEVVSEREFMLVGRPGDMVKIAGKRASLEALNAELLRIPGVRDGVFFLPESAADEQRVSALVVAPRLETATILRALRDRIDPAFLPRPLLIVDALPRNATGKLAREGLLAFAREALAREQRRA
jgi:acyl-coenzyme A synthetase/AMP-(fatty) acid ligase